ncbi:FAD-dependent oxidoreductase [bacterium]|nr:FAD-dependent oxidoreductase [bacterium]MCG2677431.1 FAD-dependent oxidoreductase [bacterium]
MNKEIQPRIAIVGGGLSGLTAAYFLKEEGIEAIVYEKSSEAGGKLARVIVDGVPIDTGALLYSKELNPNFDVLISELGIECERRYLNTFALQIGNKITALNPLALAKSRLFSFGEFLKWRKVKKFINSLSFDLDKVDERIDKLHQISLEKYLRDVGFRQELIDSFFRAFCSFAYVDGAKDLAADFGLFLLAFPLKTIMAPAKGMSEVALELKRRLGDSIKLNTRVVNISQNPDKTFAIKIEKDGQISEETFDYCILTTGGRNFKNIFPEVGFEIAVTRARGVVLESDCPTYKKYNVLIISKYKNEHGVQGGKIKHLPDGRSFYGMMLYQPDADLERVFGKHKVHRRFGWSPAMAWMSPGCRIPDVKTNVSNCFVIGDFDRYPGVEPCVFTAQKAVNIIKSNQSLLSR